MRQPTSPAVRRFAAVGMAAAVVLALVVHVIEPAARRLFALGGLIAAERELLGRLGSLPAGAAGAAPGEGQPVEADIYLPGQTEALQLAGLQAWLRSIVEPDGVRLQSTRILPPTERQGLALGGMQVTLQAPIEAVQRLLQLIETRRPPLIVDGLEMTPVSATGAQPAGDERLLQIEIRVLARVRAARKGGQR